jgi:murein DD-endopeptidase MepM/ murein hydrolase activator NlpD
MLSNGVTKAVQVVISTLYLSIRGVLLFSKKFTVLLVPEGTATVKQFRFPRILPVLAVLLLIGFSLLSFGVLKDYLSLKAKIPRMTLLERENALQAKQLVEMANRIDAVTVDMAELNEQEKELKTLSSQVDAEEMGKFRGMGGSDAILADPKENLQKADLKLVRAMHQSLDDLESTIEQRKEKYAEFEKFLDDQKMLLASTPSIWPIRGWLSSRFGYRTSPFADKKEFHRGIDISARSGSPIISPANGLVVFTGWERGYGRVIVIKHARGFKTKYAHLRKFLVKKGQYVKKGTKIGLVGNSGRTTGSHLHYEVHLNNVAVNPLRYIFN